MRCWLCGRDVSDGDYVNVSRLDGSIGHCCSICWEKRDEVVDIGLDYTEDEGREGLPEFNGAFGRGGRHG